MAIGRFRSAGVGLLCVLAVGVASLAAAAVSAPPSVAAPDLLFFEREVAPSLHSRCAGCHSDAELAGGFRLQPLDDLESPSAEIVLANYRTCLKYVDPDEPAESRLLRMPLGGFGHGGGALFASRAHRDYQALQQFALGATLDNRAPEAILEPLRHAQIGVPLELDGTLSTDVEGTPIEYRWRLDQRPADSAAGLRPGEGGFATLEADRPGSYRVVLEVSDGRLRSAPASCLVVARTAPEAPRSAPPSAGAKPSVRTPSWLDGDLDAARLRLLRRLYLDLLWRTPELDEIGTHLGHDHRTAVRALLDASETWEIWYEKQLYYFLLLDRFRPRGGRIETIPARLTQGAISVHDALQEIVRGQEFNARNPGNDTFVTVVLEQCLGVVVQEYSGKRLLDGGKKMYDGYKAKLFGTEGSSQADFVGIVFGQPDWWRHLLTRSWRELHGAPPSEERIDAAAERCAADPRAFRAVMEEWLCEPEYVQATAQARTKESIPYVRGLFVDLLGRVPDYEELRNVRNAFLSLADPTPIRLVMGRVLLESPQFQLPVSALDAERFVREQFVRLLARPPSGTEARAFVRALREDPNVTPKVVLWTLVSSPEYQTY